MTLILFASLNLTYMYKHATISCINYTTKQNFHVVTYAMEPVRAWFIAVKRG